VNCDNSLVVTVTVTRYLWAPSSGDHLYTCGAIFRPPHDPRHSVNIIIFGWFLQTNVHVVLGSRMRPCKPSALDLTIANAWVRLSS